MNKSKFDHWIIKNNTLTLRGEFYLISTIVVYLWQSFNYLLDWEQQSLSDQKSFALLWQAISHHKYLVEEHSSKQFVRFPVRFPGTLSAALTAKSGMLNITCHMKIYLLKIHDICWAWGEYFYCTNNPLHTYNSFGGYFDIKAPILFKTWEQWLR